MIVNESFARRYFPGESPLGKRFFRIDGGDDAGRSGHHRRRRRREVHQHSRSSAPDASTILIGRQTRRRSRCGRGWNRGLCSRRSGKSLPRTHPAFRLADVTLQSTLVDNTLGARPGARAALRVLLGCRDRPGRRRTLWRPQLQRRPADTRNRHPPGPRRAAGASRGLGAFGGWRSDDAGLVFGAAGATFAARFITALLFEVKPSDVWSTAAPLSCLLVAWHVVRTRSGLACDTYRSDDGFA